MVPGGRRGSAPVLAVEYFPSKKTLEIHVDIPIFARSV
jgi:hypothetical protein